MQRVLIIPFHQAQLCPLKNLLFILFSLFSIVYSVLFLLLQDREPLEGPVPHLDARLCMLLSIVPLAILSVVKEEEEMLSVTNSGNKTAGCEQVMTGNMQGSRRHGLVLSLQLLGTFSGLLSPPSSVVIAANMAAEKAATFISNMKKGSDSLSGDNHSAASAKAGI